MPESGLDKEYMLLRNLKDAGCNEKLIQEFLQCEEEKKFSKQIRLLKKHRRDLLSSLHICQSQIDCLDYLLYQMQKKTDGNTSI